MNWTQTGAPTNSLLPTHFTTFCIELKQDISPGNPYTYNLIALQDAPKPGTVKTQSNGPGSGMGTIKATEIEYMWGTFHGQIGTSGDNAAAFQLAIWKIEYDWNDTSLQVPSTVNFSSGNFRATSLYGDTHPIDTATAWLQQLESGAGLTLDGNLVALSCLSAQDQVTEASANPFVNTVPVPSTLCLVAGGGLCLFGYGFMRRRVAAA